MKVNMSDINKFDCKGKQFYMGAKIKNHSGDCPDGTTWFANNGIYILDKDNLTELLEIPDSVVSHLEILED